LQDLFRGNDIVNAAITQMITFEVTDSFIFVLLEYFPQTLLEYIESNEHGSCVWTVQKVLRSIWPAIYALQKSDIRHLDIKPENIMLDVNHNCHLIDFGTAHFPSVKVTSLVQTAWYRAPEVDLGGEVTLSADIWSLGAVLVEIFFRWPAFPMNSRPEYLRVLEGRLGLFPQDLIDVANRDPHRRAWFVDGKVQGTGTMVDDLGRPVVSTLKTMFALTKFADDRPKPKKLFVDLVLKMLDLNPHDRLTAAQIAKHPFLTCAIPRPEMASVK
jgi:serine/threonine protein kinase